MATATPPLPGPAAPALHGGADPGAAPPARATTPVPWWRRAAVAALPLGALAYVGLRDPGAGGSVYPVCPSRMLFGLDCPGCGGLRGTHALLHGDVVTALDHNVLLPFLLVLCAYAAALVIGPLFGHRVRVIRPPRWVGIGLAGVLVAFTVLRNLPVGGLEWLGSGAA